MYVRRLTARRDLVYHDALCRHVRGREDLLPVAAVEVVGALAAGRFRRVMWEGREVALNVCQSCIPSQSRPPWPW